MGIPLFASFTLCVDQQALGARGTYQSYVEQRYVIVGIGIVRSTYLRVTNVTLRPGARKHQCYDGLRCSVVVTLVDMHKAKRQSYDRKREGLQKHAPRPYKNARPPFKHTAVEKRGKGFFSASDNKALLLPKSIRQYPSLATVFKNQRGLVSSVIPFPVPAVST